MLSCSVTWALAALLLCTASGLVVTVEGLFSICTSGLCREIHLYSTWVTLGALLAHLFFSLWTAWKKGIRWPILFYTGSGLGGVVLGGALIVSVGSVFSGVRYVNRFPKDYSYQRSGLAQEDSGSARP
jgi:hypothetical protein